MAELWHSLPKCLFPVSWRCCILLLDLLCLLHASWHLFFSLLHGLLPLEVLLQPSRGPTRTSEHAGLQPLWARGSNNCGGDMFIWQVLALSVLCICAFVQPSHLPWTPFPPSGVNTRCPLPPSPLPKLPLSYPCYCHRTGCSLLDLMFSCLDLLPVR